MFQGHHWKIMAIESSERKESVALKLFPWNRASATFLLQMSWLKSAAFRAVKDRLKTKVVSLALSLTPDGERCWCWISKSHEKSIITSWIYFSRIFWGDYVSDHMNTWKYFYEKCHGNQRGTIPPKNKWGRKQRLEAHILLKRTTWILHNKKSANIPDKKKQNPQVVRLVRPCFGGFGQGSSARSWFGRRLFFRYCCTWE